MAWLKEVLLHAFLGLRVQAVSECYGMVSACVLFDTLEAYMYWRGTFGSLGLLFSFSCQPV